MRCMFCRKALPINQTSALCTLCKGSYDKLTEGKKMEMTKGFILTIVREGTTAVKFTFTSDHHAESALRAFVHSGYEVGIKEDIVPMNETLQKIQKWNDEQHKTRNYQDEDTCGPVNDRIIGYEPVRGRD